MWGFAGDSSRRAGGRVGVIALTVVAGLVATFIALIQDVPVQASTTAPPRRIVSGWLPYWTTATSTSTVVANADLFNEVSPFWYSAVPSGSGIRIDAKVDASSRAAVGQQLQSHGIKVLPTVTDGTRPGGIAAQLKSAKTRAALVNQLVALAQQPHMDGIDLDWENFAFRDGHASWPATRPAWVAFIHSLSAQLHARHKLLAVTTPPLYDSAQTIASGYWVYDWAAIAASIDRLRIMTYDYHTSIPGPIAPYSWVERVAAFAVTQVPAGKVEIGIAAYGRDWIARRADNSLNIDGVCPVDNRPPLKSAEFTSSYVPKILAAHGLSPKIIRWDAESQERTFTFTTSYAGHTAKGKPTSCRVVREVWYDDISSAISRSRLVYKYHLAGVAQWTIGGEQAAQWPKIRAYARSIAPTLTKVALSVPVNVTYGMPLNVRMRVLTGGRAVADTPVTLRFARSGSNRWSVLKRARTSASGNVVVPTVAKVSGRYQLQVPGTYTRAAGTGAVNVHVHSALALRVSQNNIRPGQNVIVVAGVNPRIKGQRVLRQFFTNGTWTTVASASTNSVGVALFAFNPTAAHATLRYRIVTVATRGYEAGIVNFTVTVR